MAKTIAVECSECGWVKNVEVEFDDGPSYLDAVERARAVLRAHECGEPAPRTERAVVTQASEVVEMVDFGRATPAQVAAARREADKAKSELGKLRRRT